jgi:hypothetical protein
MAHHGSSWLIMAMALGYKAGAEDQPQEKAAQAPATVASGPQAEFLEETAYYEQRYLRLAESVPAEKYAWRPVEGVRSIGEVYTHSVAANYRPGRKAPASFLLITEQFGEHLGEHLGPSIV